MRQSRFYSLIWSVFFKNGFPWIKKNYWPKYDKFSWLVIRWVIIQRTMYHHYVVQVIQVLSSHYYLASSEIDPFSVINSATKS